MVAGGYLLVGLASSGKMTTEEEAQCFHTTLIASPKLNPKGVRIPGEFFCNFSDEPAASFSIGTRTMV